MINSPNNWNDSFADLTFKRALETDILPNYLNSCRWFAGKSRQQIALNIVAKIEMPVEENFFFLLNLKVEYNIGEAENYFLPLSFINSFEFSTDEIHPKGIIAQANFANKIGQLVDAIYDERFQQALFQNIANNETQNFGKNSIQYKKGKGLEKADIGTPISSRVLLVEQSNSSIIFGEKYFMKLYRKLFTETNPEVEMVAFLTEHSDFEHIPAYAGSINWLQDQQPNVTIGMMQHMIDNQTDTWTVTGDSLENFIGAFTRKEFAIDEDIFEKVELLAKRTAEMHIGLYEPNTNAAFSPEPFDKKYREFLQKRIQHLLENRYNLLIENYTRLEPDAQKLAWDFMEAKEIIDEFIQEINTRKLSSLRTRIHGDFHLGQVLATENDYIIIDFEGEPESSITDRKIKHSPLKDVAGMIRSYHYAISAKFFNSEFSKNNDIERVAKASERWYGLIQKTFLEKYFSTFGSPHPLFKNNNETNFLFLVYLLEKAVYELGYEVSYRPSWVKIPLKGIVNVIREIEKLKM